MVVCIFDQNIAYMGQLRDENVKEATASTLLLILFQVRKICIRKLELLPDATLAQKHIWEYL